MSNAEHITNKTIQMLREIARCAPNTWNEITDEDYGRCFDYSVEDAGSIVVLYPDCKAAAEWFAAHLPEDCPRWGLNGYAIERNYVQDILDALERDGLISEDEYVNAMENESRLHEAAQAAEDELYY